MKDNLNSEKSPLSFYSYSKFPSFNYSSGEVTLKEYSIIKFSFFDNHNNIKPNRKIDPQVNDFMLFSGNEMLSNEDFNNLDNCHGIVQFQPDPVSQVNEDSNKMEIDEDNSKEDISEKFTLLKKAKNKKKEKAAKSQPMPSALIDNTLKCSQFPDVSTLDDESLREECKKYGLKANSQMTNKILQNALKEVFTFLSTSTLLY